MKPDKTKIARTKRKKKGNKLIIPAVVIILLAGIAYGVYGGAHGNVQKAPSTTSPIDSLKQIRNQIDNDYSVKGMPTNTPAVVDNYTPILAPRKVDKLPDYVYANALTLQAYTFATEHPEVVEQLPCYCGCGEHGSDASEGRPHRFLRDCFITDKGTYDSHASFCDICVGLNIKAQNAVPNGL